MASDGENRIKVAIRVRGLSSKERDKNKTLQWKLSENKLWQVDTRTDNKIGQIYTFDYVFGMDSFSRDIFEALAKPIVESCVQGFNGTIFAYGQTSSGKTYTMMGEKNEDGIIPLAINHIFKTVENIPNREFLIRVAYMEIYNEQIHDLLEIKNNNLKIHEDTSGLAYVTLKEEVADTPEKVIAVMKKGEKMRRFGVTDINERSSRSHTIFRIVIESRKQQGGETEEFAWDDAVQVSMLNLVDLAGSERVMLTKATGDRFKEGCAINKSLFYLGNVISQLSDGSGQYVNFRDSKLTRILRSSLGGNGHTAIICTITPASVEETLSTLSFASRAICVKNEPHVNEVVSDGCLMRRHAALVKKLELELEKARQENECSSIKKELEQKEKLISRLKDWIQRDKMLVSSPQMGSRSDRRKTWAASDLEYSVRRKRYPCAESSLSCLPEELKENDFSMETDCPSMENVFFEDEEKIVSGCSNITVRRGSTGLRNAESNDNQFHRYSWHTMRSSGSNDQSKWGPEGSIKKRKVESEVNEILQTEEIEQSRKRLEEAILRLKGTSIDLRPYSLLELVNQLASLAEEKESVVGKSSDLPMEENDKISTLEAMLQKTKCELNCLFTEKNELESLLKIEREKYLNVDNKLKEALEKLEVFSEQMQSVSNMHITTDEKISSPLKEESEKMKLLEGVTEVKNVVSEYSDSEKHITETKEGECIVETKDIELREALNKISLLIEENKKLENEILVKDCNKSILLKFKENLLNLEEKLEKSEAEFVSICIGDDDQCHISEYQLTQNIELDLNETNEKNGSAEESWLRKEVKVESLEEELYSKIDVFERLYSVAKGYSVQLKENIRRTEVLESELEKARVYFNENMDSKDKEILPERESSLDIVVKPENLNAERYVAETILMEEQEQSSQMKIHASKYLSKKDSLFKELEEAIAQSKHEIEKISLQLEQEKLKVSCYEFSLEEKNKELDKMMLREKELCCLIDANAAKTEDEVRTMLNRIDAINSEKHEAEERESKVKCEIIACKEEMIELETHLQEYKNQILALTSRNEEFQSLLGFEKQSSEEVKFQLQEALDKIAALTKEFTEMTEKSRYNEEEFVSRLDEETDKVIRLGNELQSKIIALENLNTIVEEYKLQIDGERTNSKLMEMELKEAQVEIIALREQQSSVQLLEWVREILALKRQLEYCLSSLKNEQNESIKSKENNLENIDAQLQLSLDIIETVSGEMKMLSEKFGNNADLCNITSEKNRFGMSPTIKKEQLKNSNNELQFALNKLDALTQSLNEVQTNKETLSTRLAEEMEKVKQLEEELEANEIVVANLAISEEEAIMELKELTRNIINLEQQLKEAQEKISSMHEENTRVNEEMVVREEERRSISIEHAENIYRLEATIEEYKSQLCKLVCNKNDLEMNEDNEMSSMLVELKAKISELEGTLQMKQSDISRLDYEKGELETMLISEKEKYQNISMEMNEAIIKVDIVTKEMHESTSKHIETEQMLAASLSLETEKVRKLEEELQSNKEVLEKLYAKVEELSALLNEERCRKAELEEEMQKRLLVLPNHISQEGSLSVVVSCNDANSSEKISLCEKKLADLEEKNGSDIARLEFEKGEIEAVLLSEKEKYESLSLQLSEALTNLENVTKELSESSVKHKGVEDELASLLLVKTEKVEKLEEELESKQEDMEKWHTKSEELDMLLNEEKRRKAELEVKMEYIMSRSNEDKQMLSELCTATEAVEITSEYAKKIEELQSILEQNACGISKLVSEKKDLELQLDSEKAKYRNISMQLSEALVILDNVTKALDESSAKQIEAEELSSLLNVEIQKVRKLEEEIENKDKNMNNLIVKAEELSTLLNEERNVKAKLEVELEKAMSNSNESIQTDSELYNVNEAIEKISQYEQKIEDLEGVLERKVSDVSKLEFEKKDLELLLASEKDKYRKVSSQLSEALIILDNVTQALDESSAKQIEAEELSSLLNVEIQKVRKLEEEIENKDKNMNNLIVKAEELSTLLNEERNVKAKLEVELEKAMSNSNESIQTDSELYNVNETIEKISQYEQKIEDLEGVLERKVSDVSKLVSEKKDLELQLDSEKAKYQNISLQMSEALVIVDNVTKALDESSAKQIEAGELSSLLNVEIQKVRKLEEEIENKDKNMNNLIVKAEELSTLLNEERNVKAKLEVELEKAMSNSNESIQTDSELYNVNEAIEKISQYEQKIDHLEGVLERKVSDVSKLESEKKDLELQLDSEKAKCRNISMQMSEALVILDNVTKALDESSAKQIEAEGLSSLLNVEIQKVRKLEEEIENKDKNMNNLIVKAEELSTLLNEERNVKAKLEVELEKAMSNSNESIQTDSELYNVNEAIEKISQYEQKIEDLEGVLERKVSDVSKLEFEKKDLELLLASEKDKYRKVSSQLSEALIILDNVTKALDETSAKQIEAKELSTLLNEEIQKVKILEVEIEAKNENLEKLLIKADELNDLLNEEKCKKAELEVELQKALSTVPNASCNASISIEGESISDDKALEKVSADDKKTAKLQEILGRNASEISRLSLEKGELEAMLISEKEKNENLTSQLSEALGNLDIVSMELRNSSAKDRGEEQLHSPLNEVILKEEKLEDELKTKEVNMENLTKAEFTFLPGEESYEKAEMEVEKTISDYNKNALGGDSCSASEGIEKILEYEQKILKLEETLERNASDNARLNFEKGELELLLVSEREKYQNLSLQLSEASSNLEIVMMKLRESSAKNRDEEQLQYRLNEEIQKVEKLECELKTKEENLDILTIKAEELASLLSEERCKKNEMEVELQKAMSLAFNSKHNEELLMDAASSNERLVSEKISLFEQKITEIEERSASIVLEKGELENQLISEKEKNQNLSLQLMEALTSVGNATKELSESADKHRNAEEQLASLLDAETEKVRKLEEELEFKQEDTEKLHARAEERISEQAGKISELEALFEDSKKEIGNLTVRNVELESSLDSEKETSQLLCSQLKDALQKVDSLLNEIKVISDNCKIKEEELHHNKLHMEKLNMEAKEYGLQLKEERERSESLDKKMILILEDISCFREEKEKLVAEHEEQRQAGLSAHAEEIEVMKSLLEKHKSEMSSLALERNNLVANLNSKEEEYERVQSQLENALVEIDTLTKKLIKVSNQYESNKEGESRMLLSIKTELDNAKYTLSLYAKSEKELDNLLSIEKSKIKDLHQQLSEELTKKEELINKNLELTNALSVCAKSEKELGNLLNIEKNKVSDLHKQLFEESAKKEEMINENLELTNSLSICTKSEEKLDNLLSIEKSKIIDLHKQLSEELTKKEDLINKNLELTNALSVYAKSEEELGNLLNIEKNKVSDLHKQLFEESAKKEELINENLELTNSLSICTKREEEHDNLLSIEKNKVNDLHTQLSEELAKKEEIVSKNLELANSLSICTKSEEELGNLLSIEKSRIIDLHKQLSEELTKKEDLIHKNLELTNALSVCAKSEEELGNLLNIEKNKVSDLHKQLSEESAKKEELVNKNLELTNSLSICTKSEEELDNLLSIEKNKIIDLHKQLSEELTKKEDLIHKNLELTNALSVCAKSEEELGNLLNIEKNKVSDLHKQLSEESAKKEELVNKNLELTNSLSICTKSEEELDNLLSIEKNKIIDLHKQLSEELTKKEDLIHKNLELTNALSVCAKSEEELGNLLNIEKNKVSDLHKQLSEESAKKEELVNKNLELTNSLSICTKSEEELDNLLSIEKNKVNDLHMQLSEELAKKEEIVSKNLELTNSLSICTKSEEELGNLLNIEKNKVSDLHKQLFEESAKKEELINKNLELTNSLSICTKREEEHDNLLSIEKYKVGDLHKQLSVESAKKEELINKNLELTNTLSVCTKSEEELDNLLRIEKNKVNDLHTQLSEELAKKEEIVNKNLKLSNSIEAIEEQLALLIEEHSKCIENESKLIGSNDELSAELKVLQAKSVSSTSEIDNLKAALDVKESNISSVVKRNEELSFMVELSEKKTSELEVFIKEVNKELSLKACEVYNGTIKISELESDLKDAQHKIESMSTELYQAGTNKENEDSMKLQLSQLEVALKEANDNIKMINDARVTEVENERSNNKNIVSSLQDQISAAKEELKSVLELNEGKISTLEIMFKAETEKCALKTEEIASLLYNRNEIAELLTSEKVRVSTLEKQILKEEERSRILEEKLEQVRAEVETQVKDNYRLKSIETDHLSKLELEKKKTITAESRFQEEVSVVTQLKAQLEIEKEAHSAAREAEKRILGVLAAQEKALSVLGSTKDDSSTEVKTLNDTIKEKEEQIKELSEKLEEQEDYAKKMEQMVEKMERRNNISIDHRIEIQNKAKEREDTLIKEISDLRKKMDEVSKSGYEKCDVNELEKELNGERLKKEEVENKLKAALSEVKTFSSQVEEYKKEILRCKQLLLGGVTKQEKIKQANFVECGVQTVPVASPEIQDIRPDGSGVVQYYKIDLLEEKVKKLEQDKEFLKKLCRRRHDQREELKLQLEALTNKGQAVKESENKENMKLNINKK